MHEFNRVFTKARKHCSSVATEYSIAHNRGGSISIKRDAYNGIEYEENTFEVGDYAEYDSYNYSYYGEIVRITAKTVTIRERNSEVKHRLDLATFAMRNHDFVFTEILKKNHAVSLTI